jgi:hypothetical protein
MAIQRLGYLPSEERLVIRSMRGLATTLPKLSKQPSLKFRSFSSLQSHLRFFHNLRSGILKRTPGPPPFSAINSTPAFSKQRLTTSVVDLRGSWASDSSCRTVTIPILA